jgi:hypothetical protein
MHSEHRLIPTRAILFHGRCRKKPPSESVMRLLVLLFLSFAVHACALEEEERQRFHDELPAAMTQLAAAHGRLDAVLTANGMTVPAGFQALLETQHRSTAAWLERLPGITDDGAAEELQDFHDGLRRLHGRLEALREAVADSATVAERWPRAKDTPEARRYRTFLREEVERSLLAIDDPGMHQGTTRLQRGQWRYQHILGVLEAVAGVDELFPLVPKESPVLRAYLEQGALLRATAEHELQQAAPDELGVMEREKLLFSLMERAVELVQKRAEQLPAGTVPPGGDPAAALADALAGEGRALQDLITHHRSPVDADWDHRAEDLARACDWRASLTSIATDILDLDQVIVEQRQQIAELLMDAPAALQTATTARLAELERVRNGSTAALLAAVADGSMTGAVRAKGEWRLAQHELEDLTEEISRQRERQAEEQEWRAHAAGPGVAAALAGLDAAWSARSAANRLVSDSERMLIAAETAEELASTERELAESRRDRAVRELERLEEELERRRQAVTDALENPQPQAEDAKF